MHATAHSTRSLVDRGAIAGVLERERRVEPGDSATDDCNSRRGRAEEPCWTKHGGGGECGSACLYDFTAGRSAMVAFVLDLANRPSRGLRFREVFKQSLKFSE